MAEEAHDQLRRDAETQLGLAHPRKQALDRNREGQAAIGMRFGIEEDFRMHAGIGMQPREIGQGQLAEIILRLQHIRALIVDVEKILQVREGVGRPHLIDRPERDVDPVPPAQREHQFRLKRAFDVKVKFRLGNAANEGFGYGHGCLRVRRRH